MSRLAKNKFSGAKNKETLQRRNTKMIIKWIIGFQTEVYLFSRTRAYIKLEDWCTNSCTSGALWPTR